MKKNLLKTSLGFIALGSLSLGLTAQAAPVTGINWGTGAHAISGDSDVSTSGTLVAAYNLGPAAVPSVTVNGVTFASFAFPGNYSAQGVTNGNYSFVENAGYLVSYNNLGTASTPFSSLSTAYDTLLSSSGSSDNATTLSLTLKGLTQGTSYQFEWWASDAAMVTDPISGGFTTTATDFNAVTLNPNTTSTVGGLGQYAIGTFTASGTAETINFSATGNSDPAVNAFELRNLTVPEPSTYVLAGMGAVLLFVARRRQVQSLVK